MTFAMAHPFQVVKEQVKWAGNKKALQKVCGGPTHLPVGCWAASASQRSFDHWHRQTCSDIRGTNAKTGFDAFFRGQTQKLRK
jgi:hypothetical protein